jgi:hypothetical protein
MVLRPWRFAWRRALMLWVMRKLVYESVSTTLQLHCSIQTVSFFLSCARDRIKASWGILQMLIHDWLGQLLVVLQILFLWALAVWLLRYHIKLRHKIRNLHIRDIFLRLSCHLRSWSATLLIKFVKVDNVAYLLNFVIGSDLATDLGLHA